MAKTTYLGRENKRRLIGLLNRLEGALAVAEEELLALKENEKWCHLVGGGVVKALHDRIDRSKHMIERARINIHHKKARGP